MAKAQPKKQLAPSPPAPDRSKFDLKDKKQRVEYWSRLAASKLQNRTIVACQYVPDGEYGGHVLAIELDNKEVLFVMSDDEGNGPGALHQGLGNWILPQMR